MIGGALFSRYYLDEGIQQDAAWSALSNTDVAAFATEAEARFSNIPASGKLGEAETESLIIFPILNALGWFHLPQQPAGKRREDVPDALLFLDPAAQQQALALPAGIGRWKQAGVVKLRTRRGTFRWIGPRARSHAHRHPRLFAISDSPMIIQPACFAGLC